MATDDAGHKPRNVQCVCPQTQQLQGLVGTCAQTGRRPWRSYFLRVHGFPQGCVQNVVEQVQCSAHCQPPKSRERGPLELTGCWPHRKLQEQDTCQAPRILDLPSLPAASPPSGTQGAGRIEATSPSPPGLTASSLPPAQAHLCPTVGCSF